MSDTREPDFVASEEDQILPETPDPRASGGEAEAARPRARLLPMWILIAAVVIVGVAWAMSERYFRPVGDNKSLPVIAADTTPVKVRPEEPGGVDVPDRDKYVYKSLTEEEPEAEQLLPPPEEPMERPPVEVIEVAAPEPVEEVTREAEGAMETVAEDTPEPPPPSELAVAELKEPAGVAKARATEIAPEPMKQEAVAPEVSKAAPPPEPGLNSAAPQQSTTVSATTGSFLVQMGAAKNEASANEDIARLAKKYPDILAGLSGAVIRVDLGDKGVWYRMRVGPFASRREASAVCGQLKAVDVGCFVVTN
jgi:cell division protein FtsN